MQNDPPKLRKELEFSTKDIDQRDSGGYTPLFLSLIRRDVECFELLLAYGADPNIPDRVGFHVLDEIWLPKPRDDKIWQAINRCLQLLILQERDRCGNGFVNRPHCKYNWLLMRACRSNHHPVVTTLLAAGVQIQGQNNPRLSALEACVDGSSYESLALIL
jgi:hypothetical protein